MEPNWNELEFIFQELYNKKYLVKSDKFLTLTQDLKFNHFEAASICKSMDIRDYSSIILIAYLKRALKKSNCTIFETNNLLDMINQVKNLITVEPNFQVGVEPQPSAIAVEPHFQVGVKPNFQVGVEPHPSAIAVEPHFQVGVKPNFQVGVEPIFR